MQVTCIGTGDDGTTPCALVEASSGRRLLLNASEGLQACRLPQPDSEPPAHATTNRPA